MSPILSFTCAACKKNFSKKKYKFRHISKNNFCSLTCKQTFCPTNVAVNCGNCKKELVKKQVEISSSKSGLGFCNRSCSATYNNKHKTHGTKVSKLEVFIQTRLIETYPNLEFDFNKKDAIKSELDIFIPKLNLAFELNGIFHYEPIFGKEKLNQIQTNDSRKFQACLERNIELCIMDTSSFGYFKHSQAEKFLKIILIIIDSKLASL